MAFRSQLFREAGNFTVPDGVSWMWAAIQAPGAGGDVTLDFQADKGGGGSGEMCNLLPIPVTPGDIWAVDPATGGLGNTKTTPTSGVNAADPSPATAMGFSMLGGIHCAVGAGRTGGGAGGGPRGGAAGGGSGNGFAGTAESPTAFGGCGGGSGGGAGGQMIGQYTSPTSANYGGGGGNTIFGSGGLGSAVNSAASGGDASGYGAGGGGGGQDSLGISGTSITGGAGTKGLIYLTWFSRT